MSIWDEAKHKRFHGKFASTGMNLQTLKRKHNIALVKQPNQGTHHVYHDHNPIGMISPKRDGSYEARVMRKPGTVEKVSDHPFRSRAEAAAAIAAVHPGVKSINHEPLGDKRQSKAGTGVSTEGKLPDYLDPNVARRKRVGHRGGVRHPDAIRRARRKEAGL